DQVEANKPDEEDDGRIIVEKVDEFRRIAKWSNKEKECADIEFAEKKRVSEFQKTTYEVKKLVDIKESLDISNKEKAYGCQKLADINDVKEMIQVGYWYRDEIEVKKGIG
ncbi:7497_t:CDS:2, partial [Gigaspora rosea]